MVDFSELRSRFSPNKIRKGVASLVQSDEEPDPEGFARSTSDTYKVDTDVSRPDSNIEDYWRLYEENPFIQQPIDRVGSEVMEPGWYITASSEKTADELTEYMENLGIHGGKPRRNFSRVAKQSIVQYMVRGTYDAEKVRDSQGRHNGLNPLQSDTFEIYTKPGTNILLAPDDTDKDGIKYTTENDAAAFVQFDQAGIRWGDRDERRFARDQILHWPRKPDIGDVRGTSRVEAVYDRARAVEAKLRDNDDAIAMKAWPMVLFQLGSDDRPWTKGQMEDFMENYDDGNFGPGMFHGVPGDVEIEEFAGETADIEGHVDTDVNFIMTGMPGPKYAIGAFENSTSTTVASAQERQYRKLVRSLRRDLEDLFTPYLVEVAESWNLDSEDVQLHIGRPNGEVGPEDVSGSIIRYDSNANNNGDDDQDGTDGESGGSSNDTDGNSDTEDRPLQETTGGSSNTDEVENFAPDPEAVSEAEGREAAELADPRLVGTQDIEGELDSVMYATLSRVRDDLVARVREDMRNGEAPSAGTIRAMARKSFATVREETGLRQAADDELRNVAERTADTLQQANHKPQIDSVPSSLIRGSVGSQSSDLLRDVRDVVDDVASVVSQQVERRGGDQSLDRWENRVLESLNQDTMERRLSVIGRARTQGVVNEMKLTSYEDTEGVTGIKIANRCTDATTELCSQLAGCGGRDGAEAYFEGSGSIAEQLSSDVSADLYEDFSPLPTVPPFHFGCTSEIVPINAGSEETEE